MPCCLQTRLQGVQFVFIHRRIFQHPLRLFNDIIHGLIFVFDQPRDVSRDDGVNVGKVLPLKGGNARSARARAVFGLEHTISAAISAMAVCVCRYLPNETKQGAREALLKSQDINNYSLLKSRCIQQVEFSLSRTRSIARP